MFSLIVVLLNFLKYLRRVSFPNILVSALSGLVLYLCPDFSCLMTGRFFCNNSSNFFSVIRRKVFSISIVSSWS